MVSERRPADKSTVAAGGSVRLVKGPECGAVRKVKCSCSCQAGLSGQAHEARLLHANKRAVLGVGW